MAAGANAGLHSGAGINPHSRVAELLNAEFLAALAEDNALPMHPALMKVQGLEGSGTDTRKVNSNGVEGDEIMTSYAEGTDTTITAFTDTSWTLQVSRQSFGREITDELEIFDSQNVYSREAFVRRALRSYNNTLVSMMAPIAGTFTGTVGTSAAALTFQDLLDARHELEVAHVPGPYMAVLSPKQWYDVELDLLASSGGAHQRDPDNITRLDRVIRPGYQGTYKGIDIFTTTRVTESAGDAFGGMFGRGGLLWGDAAAPAPKQDSQIVLGNRLLIDCERIAISAGWRYFYHAWLGFSLGDDNRGRTIQSRAA